jgi:signal transduction histidine kinase
MLNAPIPKDEDLRLQSIKKLKILDTDFEERFDRISRFTKKTLKVETVLISVVGENRQWFKSSVGFEIKETPRNISFCGHAILSDKILNIPDTTKDKRFLDNPLVTNSPNIRMYAGRPLHGPDSQRIGTLCLISYSPRVLTSEELQTLDDLGAWAELELNTKKINNALKNGREYLQELLDEKTTLTKLMRQLKLSNEEFEQFIEVAAQDLKDQLAGAKRMQILIDRLLNYSELEIKTAHLIKIDMNILCQTVLEKLKIEIEEKRVLINIEELPTIVANKNQISQAVYNLIQNAIKFNNQDSPIINISYDETNSDWEFHIKDNGIGIDMKYENRIFLIFHRLDKGKEYDGQGLGLSICKRIIEKHGGKIWFDSQVGQGSEFHFLINKKLNPN